MSDKPWLEEAGKKTQFSSTHQPKRKGRKPRQLKKYLKDTGLTIEDQVDIFENLIAKHSAQELKKMIQTMKDDKGDDLNGLVWGFLIAWLADAKRGWSGGGINSVLRDRKYGKVPEKVHQVTEDITNLTPDQRKERIDGLIEIYRNQMSGSSDSGTEQSERPTGGLEETQQEESGETEKTDS